MTNNDCNLIIKLIEKKMNEDGLCVITPDSYFGYLRDLDDDEIKEWIEENSED